MSPRYIIICKVLLHYAKNVIQSFFSIFIRSCNQRNTRFTYLALNLVEPNRIHRIRLSMKMHWISSFFLELCQLCKCNKYMGNVKFKFLWLTRLIKSQFIQCIRMDSRLMFIIFGSMWDLSTGTKHWLVICSNGSSILSLLPASYRPLFYKAVRQWSISLLLLFRFLYSV